MKKQMIAVLCAALLSVTAFAFPARAADGYSPVSVDEYTENSIPRIRKVYRLALSEDPALIPSESFERDGYEYSLLDITQKTELSVQTREYSVPVTRDSDTGDLSVNLKRLDGQKEVKTDDGFSGVLELDHTSVDVQVKGYKTSTKTVSSSRTYSNLSDADMSFIPKSISENGRTLTLSDVQWRTEEDWDGAPRFTARVSYTGTATSRYATGYTVSANYTGSVTKTSCDVITYTAVFGGTKLPEEWPENEPELPEAVAEADPDAGTESAPQPVAEPEKEPETVPEKETEQETEPETDGEAEPEKAAKRESPISFFSIAGAVACIYAVIKAGFWCARKINERMR